MITVTFFKLRGNKLADDFRMTTGHRGDPLGEWDYLTLDKRLKDMGVRFIVREYSDVATLPLAMRDTIKTPLYLNLHYGESYHNSVAYGEKSSLDAAEIRQWIMTTLKKIAPEKLVIEAPVAIIESNSAPQIGQLSTANQDATTKSPTASIETAATPKPETTNPTDADLQETAGGLFKLGLGIGGTLLVAALAIAGVAVGSMAADNFNNDDDLAASGPGGEDEFPLYIESITGGKMDFVKIWEERAPTIFKNKAKLETVKENKSMETPLPANVQHDTATPYDNGLSYDDPDVKF